MNAVLASIYWLALTIWIAALVAPAASGVAVFTVLPELNGTFAEFGSATVSTQAHIAGGHIVTPLFIGSDIVQLISAVLVLFTLGLEQFYWRPAHRSRAEYVRIPCLLAATVLILVEICVLGPMARSHLYTYWDAVRTGPLEVATKAKAAFDLFHPISTTLYAATFGILLIAVIASAVRYSPSHSALLGTGSES